MLKFLAKALFVAALGLGSVGASMLKFSALTDTAEIVPYILDTTVPNTYDPNLHPNLPIREVFLNAVHDLNFEGTNIVTSDVATTPGMTGDGRPVTIMEVGPLFDSQSLSLFLVFLDPTLVTPLNSDPLAYQQSFVPFQSVLFPQIPLPRTHVNALLTLRVREIPEPPFAVGIAAIAFGIIALRSGRVSSRGQ
jgi:hypothetical protein